MTKTSPSYYHNNKPELTELIRAWGLDFCEGNAVKELLRNGLLRRKCCQYLTKDPRSRCRPQHVPCVRRAKLNKE